ncbi:MAG: multicopper oxidase domain-containing protein [Saprospiraceae bacterium]
MKILLSYVVFLLLITNNLSAQSYNTLWIPDTLSGPTYNLIARDTFKQLTPGNQTITSAFNGNIWGPTLIFRKGEEVQMNVTNHLQDTTTVHWHGMHLPAVMDGGPHQKVPPGTIWSPYWKVTNNAGLYWYHPHLDMMAQKQLTEGLGGLIIIRDSIEASLNLPRTYGVDDIPLAITDRDFNTSNQFVEVPYGDSIMVNGTLRAEYTVPAQVVRFRILDAAIETSYRLGFSDNRPFYVITTDGGLVNDPVLMSGAAPRFLLSAGERVEILVNCTGQETSTFSLKAFNSTLPQNIPGGEHFPNGPFASFLGHTDYTILKMNVGPQTANPVTSIPKSLTNNVFPTKADFTRVLTLSDSMGVLNPPILGPNAFILNNHLFNINYIDYNIPVNRTEIWELTSTSGFAHPFHIHDVQFYILSRNGQTPQPFEQGWKDVVLVKTKETVRFITRFSDYADELHPFMFHCHIALHEDEGMMGQFVVGEPSTAINEQHSEKPDFILYPNPACDKLFIEMNDPGNSEYYVTIKNVSGRTIFMLPQPKMEHGIDINKLLPGTYFLTLTDTKYKKQITKPFIKL